MTRHERIAEYANHLHVEEFEWMDDNGISQLQAIYRLDADPDGYHEATLLGAWFGDTWLDRSWFIVSRGHRAIADAETLLGDRMDRDGYPNEPKIPPAKRTET